MPLCCTRCSVPGHINQRELHSSPCLATTRCRDCSSWQPRLMAHGAACPASTCPALMPAMRQHWLTFRHQRQTALQWHPTPPARAFWLPAPMATCPLCPPLRLMPAAGRLLGNLAIAVAALRLPRAGRQALLGAPAGPLCVRRLMPGRYGGRCCRHQEGPQFYAW